MSSTGRRRQSTGPGPSLAADAAATELRDIAGRIEAQIDRLGEPDDRIIWLIGELDHWSHELVDAVDAAEQN